MGSHKTGPAVGQSAGKTQQCGHAEPVEKYGKKSTATTREITSAGRIPQTQPELMSRHEKGGRASKVAPENEALLLSTRLMHC